MARWPRVVAPGFPLHITQRGNNKVTTFHDREDFVRYRECLDQASKETGCTIHAYAFMTNHVHLLVTPERDGSASSMMRRVGCRYVKYFNRRYARTGTLWEGRFRSAVVETVSYFMRCSGYVDLNPMRAHMVRDPVDYAWSSYRCLAHGVTDDLVRPHGEYLNLGSTAQERREAYAAFCAEEVVRGCSDEIRRATHSNGVFGSDAFKDGLESTMRRRVTRGWVGGQRKFKLTS